MFIWQTLRHKNNYKLLVSPQEHFFEKAKCHSRSLNCLDNYLCPLKRWERYKQSTLWESSYVFSCWANGTEAAQNVVKAFEVMLLWMYKNIFARIWKMMQKQKKSALEFSCHKTKLEWNIGRSYIVHLGRKLGRTVWRCLIQWVSKDTKEMWVVKWLIHPWTVPIFIPPMGTTRFLLSKWKRS